LGRLPGRPGRAPPRRGRRARDDGRLRGVRAFPGARPDRVPGRLAPRRLGLGHRRPEVGDAQDWSRGRHHGDCLCRDQRDDRARSAQRARREGGDGRAGRRRQHDEPRPLLPPLPDRPRPPRRRPGLRVLPPEHEEGGAAAGGDGGDAEAHPDLEVRRECVGLHRRPRAMSRPVTLFTGQWADLPLDELAASASQWGFDGLELACWGDHFEVDRALAEAAYLRGKRELLERNGLGCWALGAHLVGQAVCDRIDERHRAILPPEIYGDGDPPGVQQRAAERMKDTARAAAAFGVTQVNGFTGSAIWHLIYSFPPNDFDDVVRGYEQFAEAWGPIIDVFDAEGVRFGLEVHPTEIAYDFVTTRQTLDAIDRREGFGINLDPSHFAHQHLDAAQFALEF